jgi:hypothetical protein
VHATPFLLQSSAASLQTGCVALQAIGPDIHRAMTFTPVTSTYPLEVIPTSWSRQANSLNVVA